MAEQTAGRIGCATACLLGVLAMTTPSAASPSAKLVFARGAGTETCPDESGFRGAVAARVGYDPFFPYAKRTVVTRIDVIASGRFRARMEILDDSGTLVGEKAFVSARRDCEELVRTLALAVSLAIDVADPPAAAEPAPPPSPAPSPSPSPSPPDDPPPPAASSEPPTLAGPPPASRVASVDRVLRLELAATIRGSVGLAPAPGVGFALGAAVGGRSWSIGAEGRFDPFAEGAIEAPARLSISVLAGSLVPCVSWRWVFGCVVGTIGQLQAKSAGVRSPGADDALWLAIGGRAGVEVEATPVLAFRATLDVAATPLEHAVRIGPREAHVTNALFGSLGATAVVRF